MTLCDALLYVCVITLGIVFANIILEMIYKEQ